MEYAPYQKIPKGRNKKDLREGTIFEGVRIKTVACDFWSIEAGIAFAGRLLDISSFVRLLAVNHLLC